MNWKNPHTKMGNENFVDLFDAYFGQTADGKHTAFEAGADAMLKEILTLLEKIDWKRPADDLNIFMGIFNEEPR